MWKQRIYPIIDLADRVRNRSGLRGYYRECVTAPQAWGRQLPAKRFFILGQGRTGSQLLTSLLNSHRQIRCDTEILRFPLWNPRRFIDARARACRKEAYGFKVKPYQLSERGFDDLLAFLTEMSNAGWKIIHLTRGNLLRHCLSGMVRRRSGRSHRTVARDSGRPKVDTLQVDLDWLTRRMRDRRELRQREDEALRQLSHFLVRYEADLLTSERQQAALGRLLDWLELPPAPMHTNLVRITPNRLQDLIENYDEVARGLKGTDFEEFLTE